MGIKIFNAINIQHNNTLKLVLLTLNFKKPVGIGE